MTFHLYFRFGIFGFGMYPIGLELSVEATYPIDESAGTAIIFLSGNYKSLEFIPLVGQNPRV